MENQEFDRALNGLNEAMRRGAYARMQGKAYSQCPFSMNDRIGQAWRIGYQTAHEAIAGEAVPLESAQ